MNFRELIEDHPLVVILVAIIAAIGTTVKAMDYFDTRTAGNLLRSLESLNQQGKLKDLKGPPGPPGEALPVGTIVMWWGSKASLPEGFEIADGRSPTSEDAILKGKKPDLIDRFPKGAPANRSEKDELATGGNNNLPPHYHGVAGLVAKVGEHKHTPTISDDDFDGERAADVAAFATGNMDFPNAARPAIEGGAHGHTFEGYVGRKEADAVNGDADTTGANQPAFTELFFIVRVK